VTSTLFLVSTAGTHGALPHVPKFGSTTGASPTAVFLAVKNGVLLAHESFQQLEARAVVAVSAAAPTHSVQVALHSQLATKVLSVYEVRH
jgi:hypothetical protein